MTMPDEPLQANPDEFGVWTVAASLSETQKSVLPASGGFPRDSRANRVAHRVNPRDLELLTPAELKEITFLAHHLDEIIDGVPLPWREAPRVEYDHNASTAASRRAAKARELREMGLRMSEITLKRKMAAYRSQGHAGLIDRRKMKTTIPLSSADPRVIQVMRTVLNRSVPESTGTRARMRSSVEVEFRKAFPGEDVPRLSKSTFDRYVASLGKGRYFFGNAQNRRTADNGRKAKGPARWAAMPGAEVQVDTTPLDVFLVDNNGRPKRPNLTIMLDKATHSIIGYALTFGGTKGIDLALMLAHSMSPNRALPNADFFRPVGLPPMPWGSDDDLGPTPDLSRPFIRPIRLMVDNGADYRSKVFISACRKYRVEITFAATKSPENKAMVERAFLSIKTQFLQYLPGFTGGSPDRRGVAPEKDPDLWDVHAFVESFDTWIASVWQNLKTAALQDLVSPGLSHSPNQMYRAMYEMTGYSPEPLQSDDFIELLPIELRTIQGDGIQIGYRMFDSPLLAPYRLAARADGSRVLWEIRCDPYDCRAVWMRNPDGPGWIECKWTNAGRFDLPFNRDIRRNARIVRDGIGALTDEEGVELSLQLVARVPVFRQRADAEKSRHEVALRLREYTGSPRRSASPQGDVEQPSIEEVQTDTGTAPYLAISRFDPAEEVGA
jgi:transposase InsO family protein